jgi:hypothetical protein
MGPTIVHFKRNLYNQSTYRPTIVYFKRNLYNQSTYGAYYCALQKKSLQPKYIWGLLLCTSKGIFTTKVHMGPTIVYFKRNRYNQSTYGSYYCVLQKESLQPKYIWGLLLCTSKGIVTTKVHMGPTIVYFKRNRYSQCTYGAHYCVI